MQGASLRAAPARPFLCHQVPWSFLGVPSLCFPSLFPHLIFLPGLAADSELLSPWDTPIPGICRALTSPGSARLGEGSVPERGTRRFLMESPHKLTEVVSGRFWLLPGCAQHWALPPGSPQLLTCPIPALLCTETPRGWPRVLQ